MTEFGTSSRREFLRLATTVGVTGAVGGLALPKATAVERPVGNARSCIFINLVGGPSQVDTFDPKPNAPSHERSAFRPISTRVPGLHLSELFPKMAAIADRFSLLRGIHHTAPPIHEAGLQLLNCGRYLGDGIEWPSMGAVVAYLHGRRHGMGLYGYLIPPRPITMGIRVYHGQGTGWLTESACHSLMHTAEEFPPNWSFELSCTMAVGLIANGARFVTVNVYPTVFDEPTWDCHADGGSLSTTLTDYRETVAPTFDAAFTNLLTHLDEHGLLETTLVVATGEFGRTPWLNSNGGRDHWAGAWTAVMAGGGVQGGRVIGITDRRGAEVIDRPTTPEELVATVYHALGIPAGTVIPGPEGERVPVYPGEPIAELF